MSLPFIKSKLSLALFTTLALALTGCEKHDSHDTATTPQTNNAPTAEHTDHDHDHDEHEHHHDDDHDEEHEHGEHDEHDHEGHEHDDDDHDHHEHDHEGHEHGHHHHHDEDRIEFDCEPDVTVKVLYHADDQPPMAHVLIDGIDYDFAQLPDTNNRYRSEVGLEEGQAIIWQTQNDGKTATLSSVPLDDMDNAQKEQVVYTCKQDS